MEAVVPYAGPAAGYLVNAYRRNPRAFHYAAAEGARFARGLFNSWRQSSKRHANVNARRGGLRGTSTPYAPRQYGIGNQGPSRGSILRVKYPRRRWKKSKRKTFLKNRTAKQVSLKAGRTKKFGHGILTNSQITDMIAPRAREVENISGGNITITANQQVLTNLAILRSKTTLQFMFQKSQLDINPIHNTWTGQPGSMDDSNMTMKCLGETHFINIQNSANTTANVTVIELTPREDTDLHLYNTWDTDLTKSFLPENDNSPTGTQIEYTDIGERPFKAGHRNTHRIFKLVKQTTMRLEPGQNVFYTASLGPANVTMSDVFNSQGEFMKGKSKLVYVIAHAQIGIDATDSSVGYTGGQLSYTVKTVKQWRAPFFHRKLIQYKKEDYETFAGNAEFMDESGNVATESKV